MPEPVFISHPIYEETGYGGNHPLAIPRLRTVHAICEALGWFDGRGYLPSPAASVEDLARLHSRDYIAALLEVSEIGVASPAMRDRYNLGNMENPAFRGVFQRAATSVGGSILAAEQALEGRVAFHPAGGTHHGRPDRASGFCYFNDPAFAILRFLDLGIGRVLYVDLDAHHGDGVQDMFAADFRVRTVSIHEEGRWPGTGARSDRGQGYALNLPVPAGFCDSELDFLISEVVLPWSRRFDPEAIVLTVGADALAGDPLSKLKLSNRALWLGVERVLELAKPAVVLGGGGYNPWTVARCWAGLWARLSGRGIPEALPKAVTDILSGLSCDLIDDEDIDPQWTAAIVDRLREGEIRHRVRALLEAPELQEGVDSGAARKARVAKL
jgi:acetoin utilization protein AcuC